MANEQRKKYMLMATGDNGSVSWQPAFDESDSDSDRIVAGGYISGPSQPAAVARELLVTLRETNVRVGYATVYPFPVVGRVAGPDLDVGDDGVVTPTAPKVEVQPSNADIVAALIYAVQLGSSTVVLNDNADRVLADYLADAGVQDTSGTDEDDGEYTTTTLF